MYVYRLKFLARTKCNRCGLNKTAKINTKSKNENKAVSSGINTDYKKINKSMGIYSQRNGDWTCSKCNNLNFSFRIFCNRCETPRQSSPKRQNLNSTSQSFKKVNEKGGC